MDSADRPREVMIHQSANRPNQLMGGDRELVLVSLLTSVALAFSLASWWGLCVSVAWYVGAMAVLKRMGKADPLLRQVYMRHIRYRPFYPAKSGLYSRCLQPPMAWR
jgi:type IV secretory pathway TrbD component